MENKEKIELNTEQIELIDLISNIRKERCSHLNVYKFAEWEHYFQKLEYVLTTHDRDSDFYTQIAITSDGKTNYYKRYLSATDIVDMTECVKKINSLSSDSGEHGESLKRQSILCNKGINITFNIITKKSEHPIENDSQIYKNVDVTGIDIPKLNDYDTWHFVGDRLPKNASFMCIVKMFNEFSDTWTTGTGVYDHGKWEATDSSGESWSVRYWRRCPDFDEVEGHYVGLKEDIANLYSKTAIGFDKNGILKGYQMSEANSEYSQQLNNANEDSITRDLDLHRGDLVVLKSDATKVMTVIDVNESCMVSCMFWSNDQLVQMSFPIYTIVKI